MEKKIMPLLILILAASATGQVPTYQLETILPSPHCTSVDLSPDGTKLCARMQYGGWDEGYRVFDADTYDILNDCGGHWAPWCGLVSTDSTYLYTTLYYRGCVAKIELSTCAEPICIPVGPWPHYLAFDPARRFLYVGVNAPYAGAIGSVKVIDTATETVVGSVGLDGTPGKCMLVSSDGGFLYMLSWRSDARQTLYKISTSNYSIVGTLLLDNASHPGISISPDGATVYVPYPDADLVYIIDTGTLDIVGTWSIDSPQGFFVSPDGTHALITGHSDPSIRVFDLLTETVVQTIDVGDIGTYIPNLSNPYWDKNDGKVYVNLGATEGGVAVLVPEPVIEAAVDIKPGSCPNPLNVKSKGVLPVAILGSEDLDVTEIDVASIQLAEVDPNRSNYEDVAGPVFDANDCNCTERGPDGLLDLTLKFETQKIVEALGEVDHGDELVLELTGVLSDETPLEGSDCVIIRGKHKPINPADINKDGVVNIVDFSMVADNWLQSSIIKD